MEIERAAGKSIARIFAEDGEPAFRDLEARVIADLCRRERLVLAAGGGAPLRPESRAGDAATRERSSGSTARPETILARMSGDATTAGRRPNLTEQGPLDEIVATARPPRADLPGDGPLEVDTEGKTPEQLAEEILEQVRQLDCRTL